MDSTLSACIHLGPVALFLTGPLNFEAPVSNATGLWGMLSLRCFEVLDSNTVANETVSIDSYPPLEHTAAYAEAAHSNPVLPMDTCDTKPDSGDLHTACGSN